MTHNHDWTVFSTIFNQGKLLVRCPCGSVGTVDDPSKDEWAAAYHAPSRPYPWNEPERVNILAGFTSAWDSNYNVWTVVRDNAPAIHT